VIRCMQQVVADLHPSRVLVPWVARALGAWVALTHFAFSRRLVTGFWNRMAIDLSLETVVVHHMLLQARLCQRVAVHTHSHLMDHKDLPFQPPLRPRATALLQAWVGRTDPALGSQAVVLSVLYSSLHQLLHLLQLQPHHP
jgi:hypothetical protein